MRRFADVDERKFSRMMARFASEPHANPGWEYLLKAYAYDEFHGRVTLALRSEFDPDFLLLHFQSPDWAGHHFLYFHSPDRFAALPTAGMLRAKLGSELPFYGKTVAAFYAYADEWLGRLLEGRDESTGVLVLSDHGMEPDRGPRETGSHNDGPAGMFVLAGPGIRRGHRLAGATVYDMLPTILAAAGLPVARDLDGHVLEDAFAPGALGGAALTYVVTYETGGRYVPEVEIGSELHDEVEKELRGLGYIQ